VETYGKEDLVVLLGTPDAGSAELYAETLIHGDPTWVGPLAGISLGLPVHHILEPEIKGQISPELYEEHLALMEIALDVAKIAEGLSRARQKSSQ